jgi:uncharacterized protein with PIN domain
MLRGSSGRASVNFIVDDMLGKLTRWLRMMGHNVTYSNKTDDPTLLSIAKKENSVLLTRDFALYQQAMAKSIDAYYVEGNTETERLAELAQRFNIALAIDMKNSRCPCCNTKLNIVDKTEITAKVEKNTLLCYNEFWLCPNCNRIYWQGAHWTKIRVTLKEAQEKLGKKD